jgi:hypothetical protein
MTDKVEEIKEVVETKPETFKVGEEEYTQDQLNDLVGLGKIAREAEEKYNVKVEGIWPKFQQTINENVEFRKAQEEKAKVEETETITKKAAEGAELTEEEQLQLAATKLKSMGFVSKEEINKEVSAILEGRDLLDQTQKFIKDQEVAGNPKVSTEDLLGYMSENGLKKPEIAYKLKFEKELDAIKESKLSGIKKDQFVTESAGGGIKLPEQKPITRANLTEALSDALNRE